MKTFIVLAASVSAQLGDLDGFDYNSLGDLNFDNFLANSDVVGNDYNDDSAGLARRERPRRPGQNRPGRPQFGGFGNTQTAGFGQDEFGEGDAFGAADNDALNAEVDAEEDGRYFFTQPQQITVAPPVVIVTTAPPVETGYCWKCDAMNYADCASMGQYEACGLGEHDCCFVEIREMYGDLKQLCTGCKQANACENLRKENFQYQDFQELNPGVDWIEDQCRPKYIDQRRNMRDGAQQSVCRQCFKTCQPDEYGGVFCFGSISLIDPTIDPVIPGNYGSGKFFHIPFGRPDGLLPGPDAINYPNVNNAAYETNVDPLTGLFLPGFATSLGIPTHLLLDCHVATDELACQHIEFKDPTTGLYNEDVRNIYFVDNGNTNSGKERSKAAGDQARQLDEMTYWGLQGASRHWWENDLKFIQEEHWKLQYEQGGCTIDPATDFTDAFTMVNCNGFDPVQFIHQLF